MTAISIHDLTYIVTTVGVYRHSVECSCGWASVGYEHLHQLELVVDAHLEQIGVQA